MKYKNEYKKLYKLVQFDFIFRILHNDGFTETEIKLQKNVIYWNILSSATNILRAMKEMKIPFHNLEREVQKNI